MFASACKMGFEGIVSKQLNAPYRSGRTGSWTKAKCRAGQEVVIGGWTTEAGTLRSLLAGVYRNEKLVYVGRIGTGYGQRTAADLLPKLEQLTRGTSPFTGDDAPAQEKNVRWLEARARRRNRIRRLDRHRHDSPGCLQGAAPGQVRAQRRRRNPASTDRLAPPHG